MTERLITALLQGHANPYMRIRQHVTRCNMRPVDKATYAVYIIDTARRLGLLERR